ncbi:FMN-binding protein [Geosporobacter ferrireducens]|uniref:FMN-binding domain-containing protein n=1 Tax=Geosporobacter ferrireducens TaxID=1424294 RepID=A0A1D8GK08_9FIRM|nr:FMN-binding protein [Geosporobacter ferrireducens]AOT71241.1 hypothetical protein Gferi_17785 [Geosporobacter ferrireducens]
MKKVLIAATSAILLITLGIYLFFILPNEKNLDVIRNMPIENVDLNKINDGVYKGDFSYGSHTYKVEVSVIEHKLEKIDVISNRDSSHAKKAEGVISRILEEQSLDVDVVSGATTTSKALLKAVENALKSSPKI